MSENIDIIIKTEPKSEVDDIVLSLFSNPQKVHTILEKDSGSRRQFVNDLASKVQVEFRKRHQIILTVYIHLGDNPNRMPQRLIYALYQLITKDPAGNFLSQIYKNDLRKTFNEYCVDTTYESTRTNEKILEKSKTGSISSKQSVSGGLKSDFNLIAPYVEISQATTTGTSQENSEIQKQSSQVKTTSHMIKDETDAASSLANLVKNLTKESVSFYYDWHQNIKREFAYIFENRPTNQIIGTTVVKAQNLGLTSKVRFLFSLFQKAIRDFKESNQKFTIAFRILIGLFNINNLLGIKTFKVFYIVDGLNIKDDDERDRLKSQFNMLFGRENFMFVLLAPESLMAQLSS